MSEESIKKVNRENVFSSKSHQFEAVKATKALKATRAKKARKNQICLRN